MRFEENANKKGLLEVGDIIIYGEENEQKIRFIIYTNDWYRAVDMETGIPKNSERNLKDMYDFYCTFKNFRILKNKNIVITEEI